jgi:hypothetical protein
MAGIHEVRDMTPKRKAPALLPGELMEQLRSQVRHFEELVEGNRQRMAQVEMCLAELTRASIDEEREECALDIVGG